MSAEIYDYDFDPFETNDRINPPKANLHLTEGGSIWAWVVCGIMGLASIIFAAWAFKRLRPRRLFNYISSFVCFVACIHYFTIASHLGWTRTITDDDTPLRTREIYYVRYIDWFITSPLLVLAVCLTAALPWHVIAFTMLADAVMVVCGLLGALTRTMYRWGYFAFGCVAMLVVLYKFFGVGTKFATPIGSDVKKGYTMLAAYLSFMYLLYPIAWGLSEGSNRLGITQELIFYGVLDIFTKVIFSFLLNMTHGKIDPHRLGIHLRDHDDVITGDGRYLADEHRHNGHHAKERV